MEIENLKAVYIDDEPVNLMLVEAYGMEFNLNIKTFNDPQEGLDYILNNNIDIQKINSNFTSSSKIILETLGYVMFENNITLCEEVKRKFKLE